jgi:hypothetical protein
MLIGAAVIFSSIAAAMVFAVLAGQGRNQIFAGAVSVFYFTGWMFLPAIRAWKLAAFVVAIAWMGLAIFASNYSAGSWMLGPWTIASVLLASSLVLWPPAYVRTDGASE